MVLRKTSVLAHLVCIRDWPRLGTRSVFSNNRLITRELGNKATVKFVYVKTWSLELSQMPFEPSPWFVQLWLLFKSVIASVHTRKSFPDNYGIAIARKSLHCRRGVAFTRYNSCTMHCIGSSHSKYSFHGEFSAVFPCAIFVACATGNWIEMCNHQYKNGF